VRRYFRFIVRHPVAVLILGAALALGVGGGVFKLTRDTSPMRSSRVGIRRWLLSTGWIRDLGSPNRLPWE